MNSCFLNAAGHGDCSQKYGPYKGFIKLKNCCSNTEDNFRTLKNINPNQAVNLQIITECELILLRLKLDIIYSKIVDEL